MRRFLARYTRSIIEASESEPDYDKHSEGISMNINKNDKLSKTFTVSS